VIIATPWLWHTAVAVAAMKSGKWAGTEVPAAVTIQDCWDLVNTSEETGMPCMIMENVCFRRDVMAVLNMVRQDMFGELMHCHCGYQHDLRGVKFNPGAEFGPGANGEAEWRTQHAVRRNGDIYPTHGVGPVAKMLNINSGNSFVTLTSTATKTRGLHNYIVDVGGEDHPNADVEFKLGDIVTTVIKCANGETVVVSHDTNLPRPYSLMFRVQGTKGLWMNDGRTIYIEGVSPESHRWEDFGPYGERYDHPLWKRYEDRATGSGHGGMDFFVMNAFVEAVKRGVEPPIDVYDAAAWSVISPLSEQSIAMGSAPVRFPDFTRGKWVTRNKIFGLSDEF
jgi:predicted dehydrogenase